jgi:sigma-B regulation protein RsbU (phosphoserine phosphatase)
MLKALLLLLALSASIPGAHAAAPDKPPEITPWHSGLTEINEGWATHEGDDPKWAQRGFDDTAWQQVDIEDIGAAQPGWRWFRKHINVGSDHPNARLLLEGGDGTYELFVNGARVEGPRLQSAFAVTRPVERVFDLSNDNGDFVLALRTRTPANYAAYHLPLFLSLTLGMPTAIEYERQALESQRMYALLPSLAINLLLIAMGLGGLALYLSQRGQREYLFLGLLLVIAGVANCFWIPQQEGILPTSANYWIADPLIFVFTILQIEFTFSFARVRPSRVWRVYELALLAPWLLIPSVWTGHLSFDLYALIEAVAILPAGLLLPVLLLLWYRKGNREAGWLILPSLLPTVTLFLFDLGGAFASMFGWAQFAVLLQPVPLGPAQIQIGDLGDLTFLFAIAFVMFFRFTRVSREQARSAAELDAAREIQQRLVPAVLPHVPGYTIETAYLPAQEVGGDFYQVLAQPDGATLVVVGDVSGKGLRAAMTGALAIGAIRTLSSEGLAPADLLTRLNQQLHQTQEAGFVTCLCARIHPTGQVTLSNAGHLAPYRNGAEVPIEFGLPLGITAEAAYTESPLQLDPEDSLTLLSDGVLEARNDTGELFGFERTAAIATKSAAGIAKAAELFGQEDDITVLTLRFTSAIQNLNC